MDKVEQKSPSPVYPVWISHEVRFACGCICQYPLIGEHADLKDWHCIPCFTHATEDPSRVWLAQQAKRLFERVRINYMRYIQLGRE